MSPDAKFFHAFNLCGQVGPISFKKLLSCFKSIEKAWFASSNKLKEAGLSNSLVNKVVSQREKINLDLEIKKLEQQNIDLVTILDSNYPSSLKEIYDPPALLYIKGTLNKNDKFSLGVVGTRKLSSYGKQVVPSLTSQLSKAGLTIVSGLAIGIDTLAHQAALQSGGRTIAVIGSGLSDIAIYPRQNIGLAKKIIQSGAVISEFPPQTQPQAHFFPMRNRIIAGLSLGTLVIEAPDRSGALITAKQALEQNREVFAIPGSIFTQNSLGTNNLIKMGAKLVTEANDILEELNLDLVKGHKKEKTILANNPKNN